MVMERIRATNIADETAIHAAGTNLKVLAERGVEIFFTQVFRDSFFHADMHPGNIFVYTDQPETPRYCAIDFGIMGSLTPEDQHYLAENFSRLLQPRLPPRRRTARRIRLGPARHPRHRLRSRHPQSLRTHLRQTHQRNLLRRLPRQPLPDRAPLQHAHPAAARAATKNLLQRRRPGAPPLPPNSTYGRPPNPCSKRG